MTDENKEMKTPEQIEQEKVRAAQIQHARNGLVQTIFQQYYEFVNAVKLLPVPQNLPGMVRAYGHIDDGMLWIKEMILTAPLVFATPTPPADEKIAPQEKTDEASQEAAQASDEKVA